MEQPTPRTAGDARNLRGTRSSGKLPGTLMIDCFDCVFVFLSPLCWNPGQSQQEHGKLSTPYLVTWRGARSRRQGCQSRAVPARTHRQPGSTVTPAATAAAAAGRTSWAGVSRAGSVLEGVSEPTALLLPPRLIGSFCPVTIKSQLQYPLVGLGLRLVSIHDVHRECFFFSFLFATTARASGCLPTGRYRTQEASLLIASARNKERNRVNGSTCYVLFVVPGCREK